MGIGFGFGYTYPNPNPKPEKKWVQVYDQQSKIDNQFLSQFDNSRPVEDNVLKLIGFYKQEFLYLLQYLNHMKDSNQRTKQQTLFVYLFWLKNLTSMEVTTF